MQCISISGMRYMKYSLVVLALGGHGCEWLFEREREREAVKNYSIVWLKHVQGIACY